MTNFTVGLAGGYTAGHVIPMVALAESWRQNYLDDAVMCYGSADGIEATLLPQLQLPFQPLPAQPFLGTRPLGRVRAVVGSLRGMLAGRKYMRQHQLDVLVCLGSYASLGAGLATISLGCPLIVFEANALPGRANSLLARFASLKLVTMPEVLDLELWRDAQVTQFPLRRHFNTTRSSPASGSTRLLITGGTFGSPFLNDNAPALVAQLRRHDMELEIYHQAGAGNEEAVRHAYAKAGIEATVVGFDLELGHRWSWADAVLCTGGAGTLSEAAASGTPTLAVPLSNASDDHQLANVKAMAERHGISWITEQAWETITVSRQINNLLHQPKQPATRSDGTEAVVRSIRSVVETR